MGEVVSLVDRLGNRGRQSRPDEEEIEASIGDVVLFPIDRAIDVEPAPQVSNNPDNVVYLPTQFTQHQNRHFPDDYLQDAVGVKFYSMRDEMSHSTVGERERYETLSGTVQFLAREESNYFRLFAGYAASLPVKIDDTFEAHVNKAFDRLKEMFESTPSMFSGRFLERVETARKYDVSAMVSYINAAYSTETQKTGTDN